MPAYKALDPDEKAEVIAKMYAAANAEAAGGHRCVEQDGAVEGPEAFVQYRVVFYILTYHIKPAQ